MSNSWSSLKAFAKQSCYQSSLWSCFLRRRPASASVLKSWSHLPFCRIRSERGALADLCCVVCKTL